MRHIKIALAALLLLAAVACSKERDEEMVTAQEKDIDTYIGKLGPTAVWTKADDIYRVVLTVGIASKHVAAGDSIIFYYKASLFQSDGKGKVFDTNIDSVAKNNKMDSTIVRKAYRAVAGSGQFISGLEKGLLQMSEGEKSRLIFTSDYGYGGKQMSTVPKYSPLMFEVYVEQVKR